MTGPVSENGTPWHQLPGATDGVRTKLSARPAYDEASPIGGIFGMLIAAIVRAIAGLLGAGSPWGALNPLNWLAQDMAEKWSKLDETTETINSMTSSTQAWEGVLGFGQWTKLGTEVIDGTAISKPDTQLGRAIGCNYDAATGIATLHTRGLWHLQQRSVFGVTTALKLKRNNLEQQIEVSYDNFATLFARIPHNEHPGQYDANLTDSDYAGASLTSGDYIWLPDPGAKIRTRLVSSQVPHRRGGGYAFNCLTVKKEDTAIGPGMRLSQPMPLTSEWQVVSPMLGTGGATVAASKIAMPTIASVRYDADITGTAAFDVRLVRSGTPLVTRTGQPDHTLTWSGSASAGQQVWLEARSTAEATLNANNATWLTYYNRGQYAETPP